jgi:signal transduction histidine kinase
MGIAPAELENVFDPFHSSHRKTGGTGLGLSLAYSFVRNHGGSIDISAAPRKGTRVTVFLPLT